MDSSKLEIVSKIEAFKIHKQTVSFQGILVKSDWYFLMWFFFKLEIVIATFSEEKKMHP